MSSAFIASARSMGFVGVPLELPCIAGRPLKIFWRSSSLTPAAAGVVGSGLGAGVVAGAADFELESSFFSFLEDEPSLREDLDWLR